MCFSGVIKITREDVEVFNKVKSLSGKTCRYIKNSRDGSYKLKTTNHLLYLIDHSLSEKEVCKILCTVGFIISKGVSERCVPFQLFNVWEEFKNIFKDFY